MTVRILVIPEDFRKDQYILKPLFERLLRTLGRPAARIVICQDPLLGGVHEALKSERLRDVVDQYQAMTDVFVLCVDRDGEEGRRRRLKAIEREFEGRRPFLAENAWEELETWTLAGLELPSKWPWSEVRAEVNVKELYFDKLAEERGLVDAPGGGRAPLGREAARRIDVIRQKCPEDFDALAERLKEALLAPG